MDNLVNTEGLNTTPVTPVVTPKPAITNQYMPIAAGAAGGIVAGALLYRFVIAPLVKKYKDKKAAANAKPVNKPEAEA